MEPTYTRDERPAQRLDRQWIELLQELRVAQTGVQILFAFLLVVAFSGPFQRGDTFSHAVFAATLIATAFATGLLIAPVAVHRFVFGLGVREQLVRFSAVMAMAGMGLMVVAVAGGVLLALDVVLPRALAIVLTAIVTAWLLMFWWVVPIAVRRKGAAANSSSDDSKADGR